MLFFKKRWPYFASIQVRVCTKADNKKMFMSITLKQTHEHSKTQKKLGSGSWGRGTWNATGTDNREDYGRLGGNNSNQRNTSNERLNNTTLSPPNNHLQNLNYLQEWCGTWMAWHIHEKTGKLLRKRKCRDSSGKRIGKHNLELDLSLKNA